MTLTIKRLLGIFRRLWRRAAVLGPEGSPDANAVCGTSGRRRPRIMPVQTVSSPLAVALGYEEPPAESYVDIDGELHRVLPGGGYQRLETIPFSELLRSAELYRKETSGTE